MDKLRQNMLNKKKKAMINALKEKQGKTSYSGNTGKKIISSNETVTLNTQTDKIRKEIKQEVTNLYKTFEGDSDKLLDYVMSHGTKVYRTSNASVLLEKINEHTGFITPLEGTKAVYVNSITGGGLGTSSEAMFIVNSDKEIDFYMLLREFYLWYSYKKNMDGFDFETQEVFKKYMNNKKNPKMAKLSYDDMCSLQEALDRDSEANEFVMEIVRAKEGGANVLKKMQDGGADI